MNELKYVSSNPHIRSHTTTSMIMMLVAAALMPTTFFGVYNFGLHALMLIIISIATCVITEFLYGRFITKKKTTSDFSAVVTGLLLALNLPPRAPWWIPIIGGIFAILVVKMVFGGLGKNFMNPALGARAFLVLSFTSIMTNFDVDAYTGATPLAALKAGESVDLVKMALGFTKGTIGETSTIAILIGATLLLLFGVIDLKVPFTYIGTLLVFVSIFGGRGFDIQYIAAHLTGGGLMLGAFFMATDYVTRPITKKGQYLYGVLLGILTGIFRIFGASAEGVCYSIILGNLLVPLIEKITVPKSFGKGGEHS